MADAQRKVRPVTGADAVEARRESMLPTAAADQAPEVRLDITAQVLNLNPGLYTVEVAPAEGHPMVRLDTGLALPCARIDPLPPTGPGRAFVSVLADTSLMLPGAAPAFVRVAGGVAAAMITVYKMAGGMAPPEVRVRRISAPDLDAAIRDEVEPALKSLALTLLVHIESHGDMTVEGGQWAVAPGRTGHSVEGFAIMPGADFTSDQIEYQALLGQDWTSPWTSGGDFCGSRQMALPLLGVRVRLRGEADARFRCVVWGRYPGGEVVQVEDGELCRNDAGTPLEGMRVAVLPREPTEPEVAAAPEQQAEAAAEAPRSTVAPRRLRTGRSRS
jgi:hypothetical protein